MSACEPIWKPAEPSNSGNLPSRSLLFVPAKEKRLLRRTMSICRRMMSYPPAVPRSRAVHHPQTSRKLTQEKGHLANPAGLLVSQGVGCGGNLEGTNDCQHQLTDMYLTRPEASPHQRYPCTHLSRPPPRRIFLFPPPLGDHMTCSPLPLDNIS